MKPSSYDRTAVRPVPGSWWVWRPETAYAAELCTVVSTLWNGEEWFVRTVAGAALGLPASIRPSTLNDLSVFWEAAHAVAATAGPHRGRLAVRRGPPRDGELQEDT
jgi:hypothetical protein